MSPTSISEFEQWLTGTEGTHLEFKAAKGAFSRHHDLPDYCAALANEGGGKLVLGVDNDTHEVTGSAAFSGSLHEIENDLLTGLNLRVVTEELAHPKGRVVIFHVPAHRPGQPVRSTGNYVYPMRAGSSLREMDDQTLRRIINEIEGDFSSQVVPKLTLSELDPSAIQLMRSRWAKYSGRDEYLALSDEALLEKLELAGENGITYAALLLAGTEDALRKHLPGAEIIFEWRSKTPQVRHDFRTTWRRPFVLSHEEIWTTINARNTRFAFQEGFVQREVLGFDEKAVREAVVNAFVHRDYHAASRSIRILADPEALTVRSPGGLLPGMTVDNILGRTAWRNRLLAQVLERLHLVERSGQGMADMFLLSASAGKGLPDLSRTSSDEFVISLPATVKDPDFIKYLEKVANEAQLSLSVEEIIALERIRTEGRTKTLPFKDKFLAAGIVEPIGRGRGRYYILAQRYYAEAKHAGRHTRLAGLTRAKKKELIVTHLRRRVGTMSEFMEALDDMDRMHISNLLQELKREQQIEYDSQNRVWRLANAKRQ